MKQITSLFQVEGDYFDAIAFVAQNFFFSHKHFVPESSNTVMVSRDEN